MAKNNWKWCLIAVVLTGVAGWCVHRMVFHAAPDFYQHAVADSDGDLEQHELSQELRSELQITARRPDETWESLFTEQQINAWLATRLSEEFPSLLPPAVHDPRISLRDGKAVVACRYVNADSSVVLSLEVRAVLGDAPNTFLISIEKARAGWLPVPRTKVVNRLTEAALRGGLVLYWLEGTDAPTAIVRLPTEKPELRDDVVLRHLTVQASGIHLGGKVVDVDSSVDHCAR